MKKLHFLYSAVFFCCCLLPFAGMAVSGSETSSENRTLAEFPQIKTEEGEINVEWLEQAGDYFQEHFAFRNELVTANALINGKLLGTSTASGVIQGTDGWLYYKDSLNDYLGAETLRDRSLFNIAHTLSLMQENLQKKNIKFCFTVAPNKNSLYDANMPYYDKAKVSSEKNIVNLKSYLESEQVSYVDLYDALSEQEEILYHERDSHWNNKGAALASELIMDALDKEHDTYSEETYEVRKDFEGDLDKMLYPDAITPEDEIYYDKETTFEYLGEVESNFDPKINTQNTDGTGSLVMYRDSFGNALLPFMAEAYEKAYFSRGVPYQLSDVDVQSADTVVVERAERFLPEMAQSPAVMLAPQRDITEIQEAEDQDSVKDLEAVVMGDKIKITGRITEKYLETETKIYLRLNGMQIFEASPMDVKLDEEGNTSCGGFTLYLPAEQAAADSNQIEVLTGSENSAKIIYSDVI